MLRWSATGDMSAAENAAHRDGEAPAPDLMDRFKASIARGITKAEGIELVGDGPCVVCGANPARGYAKIGDDWYCHGDNDAEPTCYMRSQSSYVASDSPSSGAHPGEVV